MQCDFQAIYASGIKGKAGLSPDNLAEDLGPLFEAIIRCIPGPRIDKDGALQMLVSNFIIILIFCQCFLFPLLKQKSSFLSQHGLSNLDLSAIRSLETTLQQTVRISS